MALMLPFSHLRARFGGSRFGGEAFEGGPAKEEQTVADPTPEKGLRGACEHQRLSYEHERLTLVNVCSRSLSPSSCLPSSPSPPLDLPLDQPLDQPPPPPLPSPIPPYPRALVVDAQVSTASG